MRVVYEDEYLAVIHKPKRLATLAARNRKTVAAAAAASYCLSLRPVHRLDAGTFGLVIACKSCCL